MRTGAEPWQRELDHLPAAVEDPATHARIDVVWRKHLELHGDLNALNEEFDTRRKAGREKCLALWPISSRGEIDAPSRLQRDVAVLRKAPG